MKKYEAPEISMLSLEPENDFLNTSAEQVTPERPTPPSVGGDSDTGGGEEEG